MPVNLEVKAYLHNPEDALKKLETLVPVPVKKILQKDIYYQVSRGRFKLRQINEGEFELIYYLRDEKNDIRKSVYEVSKFPSESNIGRILEDALGVVTIVKKYRYFSIYENARIHIDEVEGLGWFIEFEIPVQNDERNSEKLSYYLMDYFQIKKEDIIKTSYLDLKIGK